MIKKLKIFAIAIMAIGATVATSRAATTYVATNIFQPLTVTLSVYEQASVNKIATGAAASYKTANLLTAVTNALGKNAVGTGFGRTSKLGLVTYETTITLPVTNFVPGLATNTVTNVQNLPATLALATNSQPLLDTTTAVITTNNLGLSTNNVAIGTNVVSLTNNIGTSSNNVSIGTNVITTTNNIGTSSNNVAFGTNTITITNYLVGTTNIAVSTNSLNGNGTTNTVLGDGTTNIGGTVLFTNSTVADGGGSGTNLGTFATDGVVSTVTNATTTGTVLGTFASNSATNTVTNGLSGGTNFGTFAGNGATATVTNGLLGASTNTTLSTNNDVQIGLTAGNSVTITAGFTTNFTTNSGVVTTNSVAVTNVTIVTAGPDGPLTNTVPFGSVVLDTTNVQINGAGGETIASTTNTVYDATGEPIDPTNVTLVIVTNTVAVTNYVLGTNAFSISTNGGTVVVAVGTNLPVTNTLSSTITNISVLVGGDTIYTTGTNASGLGTTNSLTSSLSTAFTVGAANTTTTNIGLATTTNIVAATNTVGVSTNSVTNASLVSITNFVSVSTNLVTNTTFIASTNFVLFSTTITVTNTNMALVIYTTNIVPGTSTNQFITTNFVVTTNQVVVSNQVITTNALVVTNQVLVTNQVIATNALTSTNVITTNNAIITTNSIASTNQLTTNNVVVATNISIISEVGDYVATSVTNTNNVVATNFPVVVPGSTNIGGSSIVVVAETTGAGASLSNIYTAVPPSLLSIAKVPNTNGIDIVGQTSTATTTNENDYEIKSFVLNASITTTNSTNVLGAFTLQGLVHNTLDYVAVASATTDKKIAVTNETWTDVSGYGTNGTIPVVLGGTISIASPATVKQP
jgi:hypothetical protein